MNKTREKMTARIKKSKIARKLKIELLMVAGRGNKATQEAVGKFMDYLERNPHMMEWLKSSAIVGIALEVIPLSRLGLMALPGFAPGAVAGYLKGGKDNSQIKSAVIGGAASWPLKPIMVISPIAGMFLTAFAAGMLEQILSRAAAQAVAGETAGAA